MHSETDTSIISLVKAVDGYIRQLEKYAFGSEAAKCEVELDYTEIDQFKKFDPWNNYKEYDPNAHENVEPSPKPVQTPAPVAQEPKPETTQAAAPAKPRPKLSEPEYSQK